MIREIFGGNPIANFHINPIVKAFIISEVFLWSAWNAITPIFAIFAANDIPGGNAEIAAASFSAYLIVRVIFELISGRYLSKSDDGKKFLVSIAGVAFISIGYIGFSQTNTVFPLFLFYAVIGAGMGFSSPAKYSLFSMHLDKNKETTEWGLYDGFVFMGMALSAVIGGFVATRYGFPILFQIAAGVNMLSIIPYALYIKHTHPVK